MPKKRFIQIVQSRLPRNGSLWEQIDPLVDLDGAVEGKTINYEIIKEISNSVQCEIQIGGGIRNIEIVDSYLSLE